jgi:hypothetical protein
MGVTGETSPAPHPAFEYELYDCAIRLAITSPGHIVVFNSYAPKVTICWHDIMIFVAYHANYLHCSYAELL